MILGNSYNTVPFFMCILMLQLYKQKFIQRGEVMLKRFTEVEGKYIEKIIGQERYAFSTSDYVEFYEMLEMANRGGYQGNVIKFFDFETGNVYTPFEKKRNIIYGNPVYTDGYYYFLQGDYDKRILTLYRYIPDEILEKETELNIDDVNLYNLQIVGNKFHIISNGHIISESEKFECYYPEKISFSVGDNESAMFIEDDKIYFEKWIEEGWDDESNCATAQYNYYHVVVVRDFDGNVISEEVGNLYQSQDGNWWIS